MAVQVMAWVFDHSQSRPVPRLVLLAIANFCNESGEYAYPGVPRLARICGLSERGVRKALVELVKLGELRIAVKGGGRRANRYTVFGYQRFVEKQDTPLNTVQGCKAIPTHSERSALGTPEQYSGHPGTGRPLTPEQYSPYPSVNRQLPVKDLARQNAARSSSPSLGVKNGKLTPQQRRYASIRKLSEQAFVLLKDHPDAPDGDLREWLKTWAALKDIPYSDACPGSASPIEQAFTIAGERLKTEDAP